MKSEDTAKFKQIAVCNFDFLLAAVCIDYCLKKKQNYIYIELLFNLTEYYTITILIIIYNVVVFKSIITI